MFTLASECISQSIRHKRVVWYSSNCFRLSCFWYKSPSGWLMISQAANARRPLEPATKGYKNVLFKLFYISYNLLDYYLKSIIYE